MKRRGSPSCFRASTSGSSSSTTQPFEHVTLAQKVGKAIDILLQTRGTLVLDEVTQRRKQPSLRNNVTVYDLSAGDRSNPLKTNSKDMARHEQQDLLAGHLWWAGRWWVRQP